MFYFITFQIEFCYTYSRPNVSCQSNVSTCVHIRRSCHVYVADTENIHLHLVSDTQSHASEGPKHKKFSVLSWKWYRVKAIWQPGHHPRALHLTLWLCSDSCHTCGVPGQKWPDSKQLLINLSLCYIITKYWIQSFCQLVFFHLGLVLCFYLHPINL